jgi:hypothetical protein
VNVRTDAQDAAAEAETILGSNAPDALVRGVQRLKAAAELGSPQATARLAHFTASGVFDKPDWDKGVDLLQQAAEAGWAPARKELRLLARGEGDTPKAMRRRVDIGAWVAPRQTQVVSDSPRIRTLAGFMTAQECAWVIGLGRPNLKPAAVYDNEIRGSQEVSARNNTAGGIGLLDVDIISVLLTARMANTLGLPSQWFEPSVVLHYSPGEQFLPHFDYLNPDIPGQSAELQKGGQRIATLLAYLNEGYEGGETDFPRLGFRYKGKTGDALVFGNVQPSGALDPRTMHAGRPPTSGEKWLLSQWIRDRNTVVASPD